LAIKNKSYFAKNAIHIGAFQAVGNDIEAKKTFGWGTSNINSVVDIAFHKGEYTVLNINHQFINEVINVSRG